MELPILLLTPLPESAVKLVTQFLRKPHPCAMLIDQVEFRQSECSSMDGTVWWYILSVETDDWSCHFDYRPTGEPVNSVQYRPKGEPLPLYRARLFVIPLEGDKNYSCSCPGCILGVDCFEDDDV